MRRCDRGGLSLACASVSHALNGSFAGLPTQAARQRYSECAADGGNGRFAYAYGSLLKTDTLCNPCTGGVAPTSVCQNGVMDYMMHPVSR
ncbi:hypothetical protein [Bradyrhizobium liaoningense]